MRTLLQFSKNWQKYWNRNNFYLLLPSVEKRLNFPRTLTRTFNTPMECRRKQVYGGERSEKSEKAFRFAEKIWKRYLVVDYWIGEIKMRDIFVQEAIAYDFLTVADDRRVRNSGIHVVVDCVSLNDFYWGSLTGFSCTVMLSSPSQFSNLRPKRG